jgi:hypothetical protein
MLQTPMHVQMHVQMHLQMYVPAGLAVIISIKEKQTHHEK